MTSRSMRRSRNERHTSNVSVMSSTAASEQYSHHPAHSSLSNVSAAHSLSSLARAPIMQASEIKELLLQRVAYLSGGKDRSGGPLIFFPKHTHDVSIEANATVLSYLATLPSKESKQRGFVIILDMENQTGQSIKALCRTIQETLPNRVHRVIVIKNDLLWERTLRKEQEHYGFEVVTVNAPSALSKYIDHNQLTQEYGGSLRYNHEEWVDNRVDYEKFLAEAATVDRRFKQTDEDIARYHEYQDTSESRLRYSQRIKEHVVNQPSWVLQLGNALLRRLREDAGFKRTEADREPSTEDHMRMQNQVERLLRKIQQRQQEMKAYLAQRDVQLGLSMGLEELEGGIKRVVDWIVGPGEKLLISQRSIGRNFSSADQLRREHEKFELKCTDTYGNYAELRHTAYDFIKEGHPKADDIDVQREYMDTVCRNFASRLERRRNMVICSTRFHRFAEDAFVTMDTIIQICHSEIPVESVQEAESALRILTENQEKASYLIDRAIQEGHSLLEMLGLPIKNAFGRDITPDLREEEQHVRDLIARLQGRKASSEDLVRIRHLKLTQIIQLRTCEKDTEQAIMWLLELVEVMIRQHIDIGHTPQEAEQLKKEHEKFGFTAKESYEYGKELVKTSLGLRRSLKLDLRPNYDKAQRLESAWHQFSQALAERSSRLSVSLMFHTNFDQLLFDINQLCQEVAPRVADSNPQVVERVLGRFEPRRQAIMKGYTETVSMGQALLSRIALPVVAPDRAVRSQEPPASQDSQGVLLAQKMDTLYDKKREMDMLWGLQIGTPVHQRKVPDWEVVARMQEGERRRRDGSQGGREPERIVVTQGDQLERMPPRQVQEPDLIIPSQQSSQFSAPPPSQQQMGPGGDPRGRPDSRNSQGSRTSQGYPGQQSVQFSAPPTSQQQMGPGGDPRGRPDSSSSQGSRTSQGYPGQQPVQFSAPPPSQQQMGPGGDPRGRPDSRNSQGSRTSQVYPGQQSIQFSAPPPSQQQMGPGGDPRGRPDSRSSQGSRTSQVYPGQQPVQRGPSFDKRNHPDARNMQGYPGKVNGHIPGQGQGMITPEETDSASSQDDAQKRFQEWQAKVIQSGDWIEVQVQDMKPKLTEVGKTLEEAERYQQEHEEMVRKIAAKQPEIAALLSQADFNISTQQFYNDVYEAMAHSLGEAWRDLNRLLEKRKQLLDDAVNFHKNIKDVTEQMDSAAAQFKDPRIPSTPAEVDKLLQEHEDLNQDLLSKSIAVVTEGQSLLEKIKELGENAPKEETQVTLAACGGIQKAVEELMQRRKMLEDLLSQKRKRLNQFATVAELDQELNKVSDWFEREGESYLQRKDIGSDPGATEALMKEHDQVENAAKKVRESVDRVLSESEQLEHSDPSATEKLRDQTRAISTLCDEFMNRLDERKRTLQATLDFYNNHDLAMNYLNRLDVQLSNLPQDPNAQAQRVSQLESAIPEITTPVARQGSALLSRVGRNAPGAFGIEKRLQEMNDKAQELESKCHPEKPQKASLRATFNDKHRNMVEWMVNGVDPYLDAYNDMGDDLKTSSDFNDGHQRVLGDLKDKSSDVKILLQIPNQLSVTGDSDLATFQQRADEVDSYWTELKIRVETRVKTSSTLVKFEKLAKQLGNAMDNIDDLFETVESQQAHQVTESYVAHIREKWDYMVELHIQLDSSGRNFLNDASQIANDPNLEIKKSSYYVDMTMKGFEERRRNLDAKYEILLQNLNLGQNFRSEWNQFLEDARGTISWVSQAETDFFRDVTVELNMSPAKVGTLQAQLDNFQPTVKKATSEIEQHLTKAELLSRRGDVEDEKTLIVEELTAVHKRLTSKITIHQVLLTLIIKFYENIDKLNKDMNKSSKQYTTAPMPEYISEAHVELQLHDDERGIINELHNATQKEGDEILNRMRAEPSVASIRPEIEDALANIKSRRIRWLSEWEQRRLRLEAFIGTDHLKSFRNELNISLDDAEDELDNRRGNYGDSPESARVLLQKQQEWEPQLKELGDKVDEYKSSAYMALKNGEDPSGELKTDVEKMDKRWSSFCTELDDHRDKLQKAVEFQDLFTNCLEWQNKGNDLVDDVNERLAQCKSPEEVNPLLEEVDDFLEKEAPPQHARLNELNQLAGDIYGPEAPQYMSELLSNNNKIMDDLQDTNDQLYQLADDLARSGRRPEKRPAEEDLFVPDGISPDLVKPSRIEEPLQATPTSMQESAPPPPPPPVDEGTIMPTHLMPVQAGVPLDQLDDTMESEPYVPLLPHQVQSVPYNVGSAVLDEYMGPYDPSKAKRRSPEKALTPGQKGSAPFFPRVIRDLTVKEGRLATFDCIVKGEPEPDIYWLRDGAQIPESTEAIMEYEDDDTCTLVLPAINLHKAGKYTCKAINPHGEATCSAVLTVKTDRRLQGMDGPQVADGTSYSPSQAKPPKFLEAPKDKTAEEGKQCRVSCEIDGIPPPAVTWSKDGDQLSDEACRFEQEGQTYTLILDETVLDDEGFYACTAVNPKGRAEKMFQIKVKEAGEAPTFVGPLIDTTADDGTCVQLKCKVQGARPMKILWRKYDIHLTPSSMYHMSYNESTGDCMLEIVIVGRNDEGEFLCRAENEFGREETTAELIVEGPEPVPYAPKVTAPLKDVEVFEGEPWELKCSIAAYPRPKLTWYKNDEPLVVKPPLDIVYKGRTAKLIVPASLMEDAGKYSVRAVNPLGEVSTSGYINVKEKQIPPAPPRFSKMLEPQVIIDGKPLELRCALTGHPPPEISWYRNNRPFPQEIPHDTWYRGGEAALRLPKATADDDGIYTCKAVNPHGQDSTSGRVTVEGGKKSIRRPGYFKAPVIAPEDKPSVKKPTEDEDELVVPQEVDLQKSAPPNFPPPQFHSDEEGDMSDKSDKRDETGAGSSDEAEDETSMNILPQPNDEKDSERFPETDDGDDEDELVVPQEVDIQKSAPPNFPPPQFHSDDEGDMSDKSDKRDETGAGSSDEAEDETSVNILPQPNDEKDSERFPETDDGDDDEVDYPFNQRRRSLDEDADEGEQKGDSSRESEDEENQEDEESREDEETREDGEKDEEPEPAFKSSFSITVHTSKPDDRDGEDDDDDNHSDDSTGSHSTVKSGSTVRSKPSSQVISGEDDSEVDEEEVSNDDPGREPQPSYKTSFAIAIRPSEPKEEDDSYREDSQSEEGSDATPHSPGHSEGYPSYEVLLEDSSLPRLPEDSDDPRDRGKVEVTIETTKVTHISLASIMILDDADVDRDEGVAHSEPPNKEELLLALALDPVFLDPYTQPSTPSETSDDPDWPVIEEDEVVPEKVTTVHAAPNLLRALDPDADWSDDEDEPATKPVFTTKLEPQITVSNGKPLHLKCKLDSSPNPNITWYKNGTLIPREPPYEMYHNGDEVGLVIPQSHKEDEGIYACRAATAAGEDMTNSKVIVTEHIKPQFTRRLQSQFAAVDGEPLELSCSVTGDPTPTIQWYKDGKLLDGRSDFEITFSRGEVKLKSPKTTVTDEGVFSCRAVNPAGDDITSCNLLVEAPEPPHIKPYFSSTLEPDLNLPLGEPLILACTVHGYPEPSVTWFKDGVGLENEAPYEITFMHGEATLQVPETIDEDVGVYSCVATNSSGEVSSTCFVSLAGVSSKRLDLD